MKYEEICQDISEYMTGGERSQSEIDIALKYIEAAETNEEACRRGDRLLRFCNAFMDEPEALFTKNLKEFIGLIG